MAGTRSARLQKRAAEMLDDDIEFVSMEIRSSKRRTVPADVREELRRIKMECQADSATPAADVVQRVMDDVSNDTVCLDERPSQSMDLFSQPEEPTALEIAPIAELADTQQPTAQQANVTATSQVRQEEAIIIGSDDDDSDDDTLPDFGHYVGKTEPEDNDLKLTPRVVASLRASLQFVDNNRLTRSPTPPPPMTPGHSTRPPSPAVTEVDVIEEDLPIVANPPVSFADILLTDVSLQPVSRESFTSVLKEAAIAEKTAKSIKKVKSDKKLAKKAAKATPEPKAKKTSHRPKRPAQPEDSHLMERPSLITSASINYTPDNDAEVWVFNEWFQKAEPTIFRRYFHNGGDPAMLVRRRCGLKTCDKYFLFHQHMTAKIPRCRACEERFLFRRKSAKEGKPLCFTCGQPARPKAHPDMAQPRVCNKCASGSTRNMTKRVGRILHERDLYRDHCESNSVPEVSTSNQ